MKLLALATAGLVAAAVMAPAPVAAARHGWHTKKVCKVVWKGHHKVRKCSTVRVRY